MKKIKSAKLKNDYRTIDSFVPKGTRLKLSDDGYCYIPNTVIYCSIEEIERCNTDLFEIEYEAERKSITVKIEYDSDSGCLMTNGTVNGALSAYGYATNFNNIKVTEVKND